jgi:hypothetical protein
MDTGSAQISSTFDPVCAILISLSDWRISDDRSHRADRITAEIGRGSLTWDGRDYFRR